MEWKQIRAHYLRAFSASGKSQVAVAEAGGVGQNDISRLLNSEDSSLGPQVLTFVKALAGLGIKMSVFFAEIERSEQPDVRVVSMSKGTGKTTTGELIIAEHVAQVERAIGRSFLQALRLAQGSDPALPIENANPSRRRLITFEDEVPAVVQIPPPPAKPRSARLQKRRKKR
jgi:transcriptional regulator with XRE-family HTH domain